MGFIKTPAELMEAVNAFRFSRVILTAYELEIFSILSDDMMTSKELAKKINANQRATDRLMNVLVGLGLLEKTQITSSKDYTFKNTAISKKSLVKGSPAFIGGLGHITNLWHTWSTLTNAVHMGTSTMMKKPINDRESDWLEPFIAAMHTKGKKEAKEIASMVDLTNVSKMIDIGGGSGAYSFAFIDKKPSLMAIVFDLPNVLPLSKKYIDKEGYSGKIDTLAGNYLKDPIGNGYDLAFLSAVIHSNNSDENKLLFKKCSQAMNNGGQLVVLDHVMSEDRIKPINGALFALNMLVGTEAGDTYTESEIKSWMSEAGFGNFERKESSMGPNMIIGKLNH